jgi:hypothetical protein
VVSEVVVVNDAPPAVRLVVGARKSSDGPGRTKPHVRLIAGGVDRIARVFGSVPFTYISHSIYLLSIAHFRGTPLKIDVLITKGNAVRVNRGGS